METTRSTWTKAILLFVGMIFAAGATAGNLTARDGAGTIGAIAGAAAGGIMGSVVGHPAAGAVIGSGLGLGAGTLIGDEWRRQQADNGRAAGQGRNDPAQTDTTTVGER